MFELGHEDGHKGKVYGEYIEMFHNRRQRHSALGMRAAIESELINSNNTAA